MSLFEDTDPRVLKELLSEIRKTRGFPFEAVLTSHALPSQDRSPLLRDDYEEFLAWRQERLWELADLRIRKTVISRSGRRLKLPANTFVGYLQASSRSATDLRREVRRKVLAVLRRHHSHATVFIFVGKSWAWARRKLA